MKKNVLLLLVVVAMLAATTPIGAQDNPCPTVQQVSLVTSNNNAGDCTFFYVFNVKNDVSDHNPKGVKIEIVSENGSILSSDCFLASTLTVGAEYPTTSFTVPCNTVFWPVVYTYTASNGSCQGGTCSMAVLPVSLTDFTAARENSSMVVLSWATLNEQNNLGFSIQRNTGEKWTEISFAPSKGVNGNSNVKLDYQYVDLNMFNGVSQYRLLQKDFDGKFSISPIRVVHGEGQQGKNIIFPNPSKDGTVNVLFQDFEKRSLKLFDQTGRILKSWDSNSLNTTAHNLRPGIYFLKIVSPKGEQTEKILVQQ
jgi:hypothetical protein